MIVVWSFIKHYNAKIYPNLIMTLPFKSWLVLMKSLDTWSLDTCKPCLLGKDDWNFAFCKNRICTDCWISYIMMYHILACSEYHYFINFIVDLGEYMYSLMKHESEIVWCDQRDLRMKKGIKLTRKISLYDLIKVTSILS